MNVSLTPELEKLVNDKVKSGLYNSASEVIREGLRLLHHHDGIKDMQTEELRQELKSGVELMRKGTYVTAEKEEHLTFVANELKKRRAKS